MTDLKYTGVADDSLPRGRMTIVSKDELARVTEQGGRLVRVLTSQVLVAAGGRNDYDIVCAGCPREKLCRDGNTWKCYRCGKIGLLPEIKIELVTVHEFLVNIEVDEVYEELRVRQRTAESLTARANDEASASRKLCETAEALAKSRGQELDRLNKEFEWRAKEMSTLRSKATKMEDDIAKIRAAIGELKMKEILG